MEKEIIEKFLNKEAVVGIPNWNDPGKLFFYVGYVESISNTSLFLKTKYGFKEIELHLIREIKTERE